MQRLSLAAALLFGAVNCSGGNVRDDAKFSYQNIYEDRYTRGNGGIIPITIERGESYSGTITNDQKYLYFSSNTSGNYDIYLRDLADVFSVPVVSTVTNQKEPAISPDGKYLVYVDDELDPDGDIILLKVNPKKLIELYRDRQEPDEGWFASRAKNLTNSEKNRIRARDANPSWSPDGAYVAWSSDLDLTKADDLGAGAGALQNIWVMPVSDPDQKRRVTTRGGVMPSFSPDGKRIVYISYEDNNSLGSVNEVEIATGATRRLTSGRVLDFYPSYAPDGNGIILTRIAADSNGDGQIDRKDAGQIIRIYPDAPEIDDVEKKTPSPVSDENSGKSTEQVVDQTGMVDDDDFVPLTSPSDHVFDSRVSNFVGGSVVLAQLKGEDINVAFIPLSGAIPVKQDIRQQQHYLAELQKRSKNHARICMALEQLPAAFAAAPDLVVYDAVSALRRARCDKKAAQDLKDYLATADAGEIAIYRLLNDVAGIDPDYADLRGVAELEPLADLADVPAYFDEILKDKKIWSYYRDEEDNTGYRAVLAFIRHEEARYQIRQGKHKEAQNTIRRIIRENPDYLALDELLYDNGVLDSATLPANELVYLISENPDSAILKGYFAADRKNKIPVRPFIRRKAEKFLLAFFEKQFSVGNEESQEQFLGAYPEKKHKTLHALFHLAAARDNAANELYEEAETDAAKVQTLTEPGSVFHYHASIVSAENAELKAGADAAIPMYSAAISGYRDAETPDNVKEVIAKIAAYYKERADLKRAAGDDRGATQQYEALLDLYLSAHANKLTKELVAGDLLDYSLNLDQIALRAAANDEELLNDILAFYDSRIDIARRFLVTEFIFGRGFLRAQLGIQRHLAAEADGLSRSEKKQVFEYFRKAEVDLNWCFFANARFADAYIMLGWMYQFIDEKREIVLDAASGKRDREIFESLYKTYFPDYLFEKNIRLYQKTLALFGKTGSPRIRNSFHLNIANNYFLLNNYSQAEEHYTAILDAKGNPDYQFESPEQEMMFYYHLGRTLYFTGKNEVAARYLRYVENNLNARYPITAVNAETQRLNQARRETAYKTFALNSEYAQNSAAAINYLQTITAERQQAGAETPVSMVYLELARLYLRNGDLSASLENTQKAEAALKTEKEIPIPKYKIRIKWFWVYEPWTWLVGLLYKLPYDDVIIGDNHLAFDLPTVNRYQLLYSIRAEIYRSKGLLHEASESLARLVEYAEKDKTKHGRETLGNAVSRRAELEFSLRSWDSARKLYEDALKQAEKNNNGAGALTFRKNIELCKLRKLETEFQPIDEKIRIARSNAEDIAEFEEEVFSARVKAARKAVKDKDDPAKPDLTEADIEKIRSRVQAELQPVLFFKGLYLAHEAELADFKDRTQPIAEGFDQYLTRKQASFSRYTSSLKYFRGLTSESFSEVIPAFEPDLKNNSLRIKLAMNRAKILQEMSLFDESVTELKAIQERSQEFRAQLEYAIASYRLYRVYEEAEMEDKLPVASYQALVRSFLDHPSFLRANTDLFERLSNILTDRALRNGNIAEAVRTEDTKRQATALPMYFDDLRLFGAKEELFGKLLAAEQKRSVLAARIRAARLARQAAQTLEKELLDLDAETAKLRAKLVQPDRLDYRYDTLFSVGYSETELSAFSRNGFIYVMRPRDELVFVHARAEAGKKGLRWIYSVKQPAGQEPVDKQLLQLVSATKTRMIIIAPQVLGEIQANTAFAELALQTSLRAAINFARNPDLARRNILQLVKVTSFFSFGGKNDVDYRLNSSLQRVRNLQEASATGIHHNVIDYEAELARKSVVIDNSLLTPAALFSLRSNPNYAVVSLQSRDALQKPDEFRYAAAADLYFSAMGVGQVLHTFTARSKAQPAIEAFLTDGSLAATALLTGNAKLPGYSEAARSPAVQKAAYLKKIAAARRQREYAEAASYAEDVLSLFPTDDELRLLAAEIYHIHGESAVAAGHVAKVTVDTKASAAEKKNYFRLLLRTGSNASQRSFLERYPEIRQLVKKDTAEYDALRQLNSFSSGSVADLAKPAPWEPENGQAQAGLQRQISAKVKNEELRNEVCVAATASLEYALVISSCMRNSNADAEENAERDRIRAWFTDYRPDLKKNVRPEDLDFNHAIALLQSGYVADSLPYIKKVLAVRNQSVSEHLLVFSLLRVLAARKASSEVSLAAAGILADYGSKSAEKARNEQALQFYRQLALAEKVYRNGIAAMPSEAETKTAGSGLRSARNLMLLFAQTVNPGDQPGLAFEGSGLASDVRYETDLRFVREAAARGAGSADCAVSNCSLLIKQYIVGKKYMQAADLVLRQQGAGRDWQNLTLLPAGSYGYTELFTDEIYEWRFDGQEFSFDRVKDFSEKSVSKLRSGQRYLAYTPQKNLFAQKRVAPPRDAILISAATARHEKAAVPTGVTLAAPEPATLYSALYAKWGRGRKNANSVTVQVKPPLHNAQGDLHIYSDPVRLDNLGALKPGGYHLFCASGEAYNGFAVFAQNMVENLVVRKMTVEAAYEGAVKMLKGRQASTRPLYYLYRN